MPDRPQTEAQRQRAVLRTREWRRTHPLTEEQREKQRQQKREWRRKHPRTEAQRARHLREENERYRKLANDPAYKAKRASQNQEWYRINREVIRAKETQKKRDTKARVMAAYGGKCACCGDEHFEFLTIDHVAGGGTKHRQELRSEGTQIYRWLIAHKFPEGFRVLCWNCNASLGIYGKCPHGNVMQEVKPKREEERQLRLVV